MFWKKFNIHRNTIHLISLSCNPVPPVRYGGIELVIAHLCEGLAAAGANVLCYSPGVLNIPGVKHYQTLVEPETHIKDGGVPNSKDHLANIKTHLAKHLQRGDVVVFNHVDHYRYLKRRLGILHFLKANFCEVAHWIDAGMPNHIIYPSAHLQAALNRPGCVIPHGEKLIFVDPPLAKKDEFLFFAGRITKDKGVDIALAACKQLNIKLVLAGPLNDKAFGATIINDPTVEYVGELTYEELVSYYSRCKAMLYMTQYTEPFGLSIIEAMAAGAPIITTGKGGTGETVIPGCTGFFAQTADDIVLAYAQLEKIRPEDCVTRAKDYTLDVMTRNYLALFHSF